MIATKPALAAGLALAFGLTGVSTASAATSNSPRPAPPSGSRSCEVKMQNADGSSYSVYYDHGSKLTLKGSDGNKTTKKCNDGTWESTKLAPAAGARPDSSGPTVAQR